jgi:ABC-type Na+ efflux pump permease subunit
MTITTRKIVALQRPVRDIAPAQIIPAERAEAAQRAHEAAGRAAFFEDMEMAMTGLVLVGALLFTAGLIRYGAPAGQVRDAAAATFYTFAAIGGTSLGLFTIRSIWRRLTLRARRPG